MPCDLTRYGPDWSAFRVRILARATMRCECTGQCGLHQAKHIARRCIERHGQQAIFARGKIVLAVAHLCSCDPPCTIPAHVRAMCQRCHLRLDRFLHAEHAALTTGRFLARWVADWT